MVQYNNLSTTLRVAGGWVRDKLIKRICKADIDIALDNITGQEFARALKQFYNDEEIVKKLNKSYKIDIGGFGIVPINPEQRKHLETATLRILGVPIDFVNLRKEE
jgi:tRNA nucleotidyltransferase (CCA-adding enzyme)